MAVTRGRWLKSGADDDPLVDGLRAALPALAGAVADPDVRVRRAALDTLEQLGPLAAASVPAVGRALADRDHFVRWSAVRVLNAAGPGPARQVLANLARLLEDTDLDVRLAATAALENLDPSEQFFPARQVVGGDAPPPASEARAILPGLLRSLKAADVETRLKALHALRGLDDAARPAVPALREALRDPSARSAPVPLRCWAGSAPWPAKRSMTCA